MPDSTSQYQLSNAVLEMLVPLTSGPLLAAWTWWAQLRREKMKGAFDTAVTVPVSVEWIL
jgi:hypothetical protein